MFLQEIFSTKLSGEDWNKEQEKDENGIAPVTLKSIEKGMHFSFNQNEKSDSDEEAVDNGMTDRTCQIMTSNEKGRFAVPHVSDMALCHLIDKVFVPKNHRTSVYHLSEGEKRDISKFLITKYRATNSQLKRCLWFR